MYTPENKKSNGNKASVLQAKKSSTGPALSLPAVPVLQQKANDSGLPDNLRSGVEQLSGFSMDDVKVHYNSSQPAQLNAFAYARGTDIHVAPGQEKHLPHEAWHVAQQKQGKVQPTTQMKQGIPVNDDEGLEKEADEMGQKSLQQQAGNTLQLRSSTTTPVYQLTGIAGGKLTDNKGRVEEIALGKISTFHGFDAAGIAKTLKINVKGNGVVTWYKLFDKGGAEPANTPGPALPVFYFRKHDVPGYLPEWGYGTDAAESESAYGKVKIASFRTPSGKQPVDVKIESKNKLTVDRKFVIDAVFDESEMKEGYRVEYRQYIKGFIKYNNNVNPHKLYKGVALSAGGYNEDGNGKAAPYGRRENTDNELYVTGNKSAITYHAEDIPGIQINKNDTCEISLFFKGQLVVVQGESEVPVTVLLERLWDFGGHVKNRGNGLFDIT